MKILKYIHIFIFLPKIVRGMVSEKQERTVVHLQIEEQHYYFGSIKALCDHFSKDKIGISYKSLANFGVTQEKPYRNKYCTIRKGILLTAPKADC